MGGPQLICAATSIAYAMAGTEGARFDNGTRKALKRMVEEGEADSKSDALQTLVIEGLARRGHLDRSVGNRVGWVLGELARLFGYSGLAWFAIAVLVPAVQLQWFVMLLMTLALGCVALKGVLATSSVGLGQRVRAVVGGEKA